MSDDRGFFAELLLFARYYWLWWVLPIVVMMLGILLIALAGSGSEGGFTYDLF